MGGKMILNDYLNSNMFLYIGAGFVALLIFIYLLRQKKIGFQKELDDIINNDKYKVKSQWDIK